MPVLLRNVQIYKLSWKAPAYHTVMQTPHNPLYAGAYAFGRIAQKTRIGGGRARKVSGFKKPQEGMECSPARQSSRLYQLSGV
jgi:hypothetical protein